MSPDQSCRAQLGLPWLGDTGCCFSASKLSHGAERGDTGAEANRTQERVEGYLLGAGNSLALTVLSAQSTAWTRSVPSQQQPSAVGNLRKPVRGR